MTRMKKTISILLAVLFLLTVTAGAVSALNPQPEPPIIFKPHLPGYLILTSSAAVGPMGMTPFPSISDAFRPSNKDGLQTGGGIKITSTSTKNIGNNINQ